jgi:hypothetical protein
MSMDASSQTMHSKLARRTQRSQRCRINQVRNYNIGKTSVSGVKTWFLAETRFIFHL